MVDTVMWCMGVAILLSALLWGINRLAPDPIKTWLTVVVVVIAACFLAAFLMGGLHTGSVPQLHR